MTSSSFSSSINVNPTNHCNVSSTNTINDDGANYSNETNKQCHPTTNCSADVTAALSSDGFDLDRPSPMVSSTYTNSNEKKVEEDSKIFLNKPTQPVQENLTESDCQTYVTESALPAKEELASVESTAALVGATTSAKTNDLMKELPIMTILDYAKVCHDTILTTNDNIIQTTNEAKVIAAGLSSKEKQISASTTPSCEENQTKSSSIATHSNLLGNDGSESTATPLIFLAPVDNLALADSGVVGCTNLNSSSDSGNSVLIDSSTTATTMNLSTLVATSARRESSENFPVLFNRVGIETLSKPNYTFESGIENEGKVSNITMKTTITTQTATTAATAACPVLTQNTISETVNEESDDRDNYAHGGCEDKHDHEYDINGQQQMQLHPKSKKWANNSPGEFGLVTTALMIRWALKHTYNYKNNKKDQRLHPVLQQLDDMQKRIDVKPGWLRQNEALAHNRPIPDPRSFLTSEEKDLLLKLALILKPIVHQTTSKLAYAWGITRNSVNNIINRACESANLCASRKRRSDAGETITNCERKRKAVVTPFFVFKKMKRYERSQLLLAQKSSNGGIGNVSGSNNSTSATSLVTENVNSEAVMGNSNNDLVATEELKPFQAKELRALWNTTTQEEKKYYEQLAKEEQRKLNKFESNSSAV